MTQAESLTTDDTERAEFRNLKRSVLSVFPAVKR